MFPPVERRRDCVTESFDGETVVVQSARGVSDSREVP